MDLDNPARCSSAWRPRTPLARPFRGAPVGACICYGRPMAAGLWLAAVLAFAPGTAKRGNEAIRRDRGVVYSLAAAPRLGVLLAGGAQVMRQPVGFGAGLQFRVHALHLGPVRLGGELQLGHTRFLDRRTVPHIVDGDDRRVRRYATLNHTDFAAGPSLQIVTGPVFWEMGFGAGLGISSFVRPFGAHNVDEERFNDVTAMIRGGGHLGIPIRNNHGFIVGTAVHKYFSRLQMVAEPDPGMPDAEPDTNPFDLMLEIHLGYHMMF
jgi:hypothetical protein